jgi:hypothetical protein
MNSLACPDEIHRAFGRRAPTPSAAAPGRNIDRARGLNELSKMIPQSNSNTRNRPRHNAGRNPRPAQAGAKTGSGNPGQWQQKYDHYCNLAQATNSNDAVTREGHWQHAEHFLRLMNGSAS